MPQVKSKFKHAAVENKVTLEDCYTDLISKFYTSGDTNFSSASAKFMCLHGGSGGGPLMVMQLGKPGRKARDKQNLVSIHEAKVIDSAWSPHSDRLLCSGDANGMAKIMFFEDSMFDEDGLLHTKIEEATQTIETGFKKSVTSVAWHPSVANLIAISSKEKKIAFFDATSGQPAIMDDDKPFCIETSAVPLSLTWDWSGELLGFIEKDGANNKLTVWNIRNKEEVWSIKLGMKACQCTFMDNEEYHYITAVGCEAASGKRYFKTYNLDGTQKGSNWNIPEKGSQGIMPFWDAGRGMMWYYAKGDLSVSFALWLEKKESFFSMGLHRSSDPIRGGCFVNQRAMDVMDCEIQSFVAMRDRSGPHCAIFKFTVPRRQKTQFAPELFPDCPSLKPVCSIEEFLNGAAIGKPNMTSLDPDNAGAEDDGGFVKKMSYADLEARVKMLEAALQEAGIDIPE